MFSTNEILTKYKLLSPDCIKCYGTLHQQDIYCNDYINIIINLLNNNNKK